jgi:hypothetical protein
MFPGLRAWRAVIARRCWWIGGRVIRRCLVGWRRGRVRAIVVGVPFPIGSPPRLYRVLSAAGPPLPVGATRTSGGERAEEAARSTRPAPPPGLAAIWLIPVAVLLLAGGFVAQLAGSSRSPPITGGLARCCVQPAPPSTTTAG